MPDVRTFRAATMREALDRVQSELGREAVILATRQVPAKRLMPWGAREEVEITAGLGIATKPLPQSDARRAAHRTGEIIASLEQRAEGAVRGIERSGQFTSQDLSLRTRPAFRPHGAEQPSPGLVTGNDITARLDAIERMLVDLNRRQRSIADIPAGLRSLYDGLLSADVEETIARELIESLGEQLTAAQLADPAAVRLKLIHLIEAEIRCVGPIAAERGRRMVVALAGPTGVGKTTTLAKLAANFRLREGLRTGLVTVDTYRIAAVDQLRTYAEIIELPMKVVGTPAEMRTALDEFAGLDLVLIDTAGRSPRDAGQISDLHDLLTAAKPDAVHLVLSVTAGRKHLVQAIEAFKSISPSAVLVTKLDEAEGTGAILALCRDGGLPLSYVTLGQDVPDDIEPARPDRIAKWIVNDGRGQRPAFRSHDPTSF